MMKTAHLTSLDVWDDGNALKNVALVVSFNVSGFYYNVTTEAVIYDVRCIKVWNNSMGPNTLRVIYKVKSFANEIWGLYSLHKGNVAHED